MTRQKVKGSFFASFSLSIPLNTVLLLISGKQTRYRFLLNCKMGKNEKYSISYSSIHGCQQGHSWFNQTRSPYGIPTPLYLMITPTYFSPTFYDEIVIIRWLEINAKRLYYHKPRYRCETVVTACSPFLRISHCTIKHSECWTFALRISLGAFFKTLHVLFMQIWK